MRSEPQTSLTTDSGKDSMTPRAGVAPSREVHSPKKEPWSLRESVVKPFWYYVLQEWIKMACVLLFHIRVCGRHHVPVSGGALLVANHQSYLDSMLVGVGLRRRLNYVARFELFWFAPFRWLLSSLDAIPIRSKTLGVGGIKESLRRLRQGRLVLIFPEGSRSRDGRLGRLRPGFCALVTRADVPILPVGIQGAYEAWPAHRRIFRPHRVSVCYGTPIAPQEFRSLSEAAAVNLVAQRLADTCWQARRCLKSCKLHDLGV